MPLDTAITTFSAAGILSPYMDPKTARAVAINLKPASTGTTYSLTKGTVLAAFTATATIPTTGGTAGAVVYGSYVAGNVDGTQFPRGLLAYTVMVDDQGRITLSSDTTPAPWSQTQLTVEMFVHGTFRGEDVIGLDAAGVTKLAGNMITGAALGSNLTTGIFSF